MAVKQIRASVVMIITILLAGGLFSAVNISEDSASAVTLSAALLKTAAVGDNVSYGRVSDGEGQWYKISQKIVVPAELVINEFMADNGAAVKSPYGTYPDWIELYNGGEYIVDLSEMYLTDDISNPTWQFPAGTVIEPNGYLLIWADGDSGQDSLHANFRLRANGETIGLFASDGETLIDSVVYDKQLRDVSYGRTPDGSSNWNYMVNPTAGEANVGNTRKTFDAWQVWLLSIPAVATCIVLFSKTDSERGGRNNGSG
jgi:hypothetical protein